MDMDKREMLNNISSPEFPEKSIKELESIRNAYEIDQKYKEAFDIHKAILKKIKEETRKREDQKIAEQDEIHYAMIQDFNSECNLFEDRWKELISNNDKKFKKERDKAESEFKNQFRYAKEQLKQARQNIPIFSGELATLKNTQNKMARDKEYEMADIIKLHLIEFENEEKNNWKISQEKLIKIELDKMKAKHKDAMNNIDLIEKTEMKTLKYQRHKERMDLIKKYQEINSSFGKTHKLIVLERLAKNGFIRALVAAIFLFLFTIIMIKI